MQMNKRCIRAYAQQVQSSKIRHINFDKHCYAILNLKQRELRTDMTAYICMQQGASSVVVNANTVSPLHASASSPAGGGDTNNIIFAIDPNYLTLL
jgi:hypothetical protein